MSLPSEGLDRDQIVEQLRALRTSDADWKGGRTWSLVYHAGEDVEELWNEVYTLFAAENALNPLAFPSLLQLENEVVRMSAGLLQGDSGVVGEHDLGWD